MLQNISVDNKANGYYCQKCGQWVGEGSYHFCAGYPSTPSITYYSGGWPPYIDNQIIERIAVALEKIAAHLGASKP